MFWDDSLRASRTHSRGQVGLMELQTSVPFRVISASVTSQEKQDGNVLVPYVQIADMRSRGDPQREKQDELILYGL